MRPLGLLLLSLVACGPKGPDNTGVNGGNTNGATGSTGTTGDTSGATMRKLTINNVLSWCTISITNPATTLPNGATAASNVVSFPDGTVVHLHGDKASSSFKWATSASEGGWQMGVDAGQDPVSQDTVVTMTSDKTVKVCCPFTNGSGC